MLRASHARFPSVGKTSGGSDTNGASASLWAENGTATISVPAGAGYVKVQSFLSAKSVGLSADLANNRIELTETGNYDVSFAASTLMDASNVELQTQIRAGGVPLGDLRVERKFPSANAKVPGTIIGTLEVPDGAAFPVYVEVWTRHMGLGTVTLTPTALNLTVRKRS